MAESVATPYRHTQVSTRRRCPVCNSAVFSTSDIHPQCAVKRQDDLQRAERKAAEVAQAATA